MGERFEDALGETQNAYALQPRTALQAPEAAPGASREAGARAASLHIADAGFCGVLLLKADFADVELAERFAQVFGDGPPEIGRVAALGAAKILRLSESEALALTRYEDAAAWASKVESAFAAAPSAAAVCAPMSDAYAVLRLAGPGAREALAKGAAMDFHPRSFRDGDVARVRVGPVETIILAHAEAGEGEGSRAFIDILAPRSQARALFSWLAAAAATRDGAAAIPDR